MADTIKKYVSLENLNKYDELLKAKMATDDASILAQAKQYCDDKDDQFEAVGAVATGVAEAKSYTDTEVAKVNSAASAAQSTADEAKAAAATADGKAVAAQEDVDNLATYVGTIPTDEKYANIDNVVAYVNKKAEETLAAAQGGSSETAASVKAALDTYKAQNDPKVEANATAAANAQTAADNAQSYAEGVDAKVDTLIGEDANKSVRTIANEELAKQLIPDNAKESLDTLQEIASWIQSHPDDASAMNEAIVALQKKVDTGNKTVSAYVTDAITALSIGDYAKAADLTALAGRVSQLESASATHALKSEVTAVSDALTTYQDAHAGDYTNAQVDAAIKAVADDVAALNDTYASDEELAQALEDEVARANGAYAAKALEQTVTDHKADAVVHITTDERTLWNGALHASDIVTGSANGAIAVRGTDVAVKGLGSAAYAETSAFDAFGSASAVQDKLDEEVLRAKAAEQANADAIAAFIEVSEAEINALFA